ncbi:hypothetical protein AB205_0126880, partial [Aquarana catesbeiana]
HLLKTSFDVVKRWVNEAQEAASSDNMMVQYHALGLLYHVRKNDRLSVNKMLSKFMRHGLKSPFAYCMMIRVASKLLEEEDGNRDSPLFDFIESCLRNKHEMVVYEAASAIVNLPSCTAKELAPAGGFEYKRAIVDCIISIIEENPESKETGLSHLCEFIEDCEFTVLATRILHLLGQEGPRTANPSKYIRFIYNRVILENEEVRAGAVSALAKFGAQNEDVLPSILVLLRR